jgi:hypothetical protein
MWMRITRWIDRAFIGAAIALSLLAALAQLDSLNTFRRLLQDAPMVGAAAVSSVGLRILGKSEGEVSLRDSGTATAYFEWRDDRAQAEHGNVRISTHWAEGPQADSLADPNLCGFVVREHGATDGAVFESGRANVSEPWECILKSTAGSSRWTYFVKELMPRCDRRGWVVARMNTPDIIDRVLQKRMRWHADTVSTTVGAAFLVQSWECAERFRSRASFAGYLLATACLAGGLLRRRTRKLSIAG